MNPYYNQQIRQFYSSPLEFFAKVNLLDTERMFVYYYK